MAMGIFAIVAGITTYLFGKFADVVDSKKIIILGYFLMGLAFLLYNFTTSLFGIYCLQVLMGLGEAIYSPAFDKSYTESMPKNKIGSTWGVWELSNYFSQAIGALIGGLISEYYGFNVIFITISLMCFTSCLWIYSSKELATEITS